MSPNCCSDSLEYATVDIFVPANKTSALSWGIPFRDSDGDIIKNGSVKAKYCPFCGTKLSLTHVPFETS